MEAYSGGLVAQCQIVVAGCTAVQSVGKDL